MQVTVSSFVNRLIALVACIEEKLSITITSPHSVTPTLSHDKV